MKRIFFLFLSLLLSSCAPRLTTTIAPPPGPKVVFVQSAKPVVLGGLSEEEVANAVFGRCAIANRGSIRFYGGDCSYVYVWLEIKGDREPDFKLIPGQIQDVIAPIGVLRIYAEMEWQDLYEWHDFGESDPLEVRIFPGGRGWSTYLSPGNFPGWRNY